MSLFQSIPIWGWLDVFFTILVLLGVCGESDWFLKLIIHDPPNNLVPVQFRQEKIKKIFEAILIFGIAGELMCLPFSLWESAEFNKEAADARLNAGAALERAANTESNNLVLRAKIVELEQKMQPRTVTKEQQDQFVKLLTNAPKCPIWILCSDPTSEMLNYIAQLRKMLNEAGYGITGSNPSEGLTRQFGTGTLGDGVYCLFRANPQNPDKVNIMLLASQQDYPPACAISLECAFDQVGIKTELWKGPSKMDRGVLIIWVFNKPDF